LTIENELMRCPCRGAGDGDRWVWTNAHVVIQSLARFWTQGEEFYLRKEHVGSSFFSLSFFPSLFVSTSVSLFTVGVEVTIALYHTQTHTTLGRTHPGRRIGPFQWALPDNTQPGTDMHATGGIRTRHLQQASGRSPTSWTVQPMELALGGSVVQKWHTLVFSCRLPFHKGSSFTVTVSPQHMLQTNMD
jgi:hypothetical protein